ncbi:response regulator [Novosphingobium sp. AP12]|uniref:response regulator n=1 Tax=Novosphingobium sp. AP12 TaxID=1144305 RepID=UPI0009D95CB9|nr:response regulator [Novosphingobium sp. AP12]
MNACEILEEAGFRFYEAADGDAAMQLLDQHADNVILLFTDVEMPGSLNGFELARAVDAHWPEIGIVVASGRLAPEPGDMPDRATSISKPFSKDVVHDHLRAPCTSFVSAQTCCRFCGRATLSGATNSPPAP